MNVGMTCWGGRIGIVPVDAASKPSSGVVSGSVHCFQRFPTDPAGVTAVTFDGVAEGTEIHVYLPDGAELAGTESCGVDHVLTWPVYALGSANNKVTITLIKRGLKWQKFKYTSKVGEQSLPIFQQADLGYNNPA